MLDSTQKGYRWSWNSEDRKSVCSVCRINLGGEREQIWQSRSYMFRNSLPLHPRLRCHIFLDLDKVCPQQNYLKSSRSLSWPTPVTFFSTPATPTYLQTEPNPLFYQHMPHLLPSSCQFLYLSSLLSPLNPNHQLKFSTILNCQVRDPKST